MSIQNIRAEVVDIRIAAGLQCPHCGRAVTRHAVERRDRGGMTVICQACHRDIVMIEPAE